jgi:hypothetical protein
MFTRTLLPQLSETGRHAFRSDRPSTGLTAAAVIRIAVLTLLAALSSPQRAAAHHSGSEYDSSRTVEIEGTLVALSWQNPHVHLTVRTADPGGQQVTWDIEANSLSVLRRTNATPEKLHIGDKVRVAGQPSARAPNRIFATNLLCADGTELVLGPLIQRRWTGPVVGSTTSWLDPGTADTARSGIFRVWSTKLDDPGELWLEHYPLTAVARKIVAKWDPVHDTVAHGCEPKGMPTIMEQPYPMEFIKGKEGILLRMEEYDTVRTLYMADNIKPDSLAPGPLGRSKGHWEGSTLVVTTNGITWAHLDTQGTPLSPQASLVERFAPSVDGARLLYSVVITDPKYLTKPVELKRSWVARPGESVKPYNCGRPSPRD